MLQQRKYWVIYDPDPKQVKSANFDVKEGSVQLVAAGLGPLDALDVEVRVDGGTTTNPADFVWEKLSRNGCAVQLKHGHNQLVINIPGVYRIVRPATVAGPLRVALWESDREYQLIELSNQMHVHGGAGTDTCAPPCASPPMSVGDKVNVVERCDATTKAPVTLLVKVGEPNNAVCPPVPGAIEVVGYMLADGTMAAGPYPGTLGVCDAPCQPSTPMGLVTTWG